MAHQFKQLDSRIEYSIKFDTSKNVPAFLTKIFNEVDLRDHNQAVINMIKKLQFNGIITKRNIDFESYDCSLLQVLTYGNKFEIVVRETNDLGILRVRFIWNGIQFPGICLLYDTTFTDGVSIHGPWDELSDCFQHAGGNDYIITALDRGVL